MQASFAQANTITKLFATTLMGLATGFLALASVHNKKICHAQGVFTTQYSDKLGSVDIFPPSLREEDLWSIILIQGCNMSFSI